MPHCFQNGTECNNKKDLLKKEMKCGFIGKPKPSVEEGRLPDSSLQERPNET